MELISSIITIFIIVLVVASLLAINKKLNVIIEILDAMFHREFDVEEENIKGYKEKE